ncbi:MAG: hypothetical protein Kow0074_24550 [Candidatus Zixiibacteriota bacterium]
MPIFDGVVRGPSWSVLAVLVVLAVGFALLFWHSYSANDGHAIFALDDPYIHLAMARNLAHHGVWGVMPDAFSATSSSPLYTLLLGGLFLFSGATTVWSWVLAITGGLLVAVLLSRRLAESFQHPGIIIVGGIWCLIVAGIPESMFTGLEHTLHAASMIGIAYLLAGYAESTQRSPVHELFLLVTLVVAGGLRYESLFAIPFVFAYLFWRKRRGLAVLSAVVGVLPALVMGVVQVANGALLLPNSILLKGVAVHDGGWGYIERFLAQIDSPFVSVLVMICALGILLSVLGREQVHKDPRLASTGLFLSIVVFHALFAQMERRYVPYLIVLGIWAAIPWISEWVREVYGRFRDVLTGHAGRRRVVLWLSVIAVGVLPYADRLLELGRLTKLGHDIYLQQYQVARFWASEYPDETVALNDIGTTAWAGANPVLDLWGLGNGEIARERFNGTYNSHRIRSIVDEFGARVAAVYPHWFVPFGGMPPEWQPVGAWRLPPGTQVNAAGPQVVFYATSVADAQILSRRLKAYASQLPEGVTFTPFM